MKSIALAICLETALFSATASAAPKPEIVIGRQIPSHNALRSAPGVDSVGMSPGAMVSQQTTTASQMIDDQVLAGVGTTDSHPAHSGAGPIYGPSNSNPLTSHASPLFSASSRNSSGQGGSIGQVTGKIAPLMGNAMGGLTGGLK